MEAWFNEQSAGRIGGVIGGCVGIAGGIVGCVSGLCVRKGWKRLMYGMFGFCIVVSAAFLIAGLVALLNRQPYHVWYVFALPGLTGTAVFGGLMPVMRKRFTENKLRQMQAKDI